MGIAIGMQFSCNVPAHAFGPYLSQFMTLLFYIGVLLVPGPVPPVTDKSKAVIGAMQARATAKLAVEADGVQTLAEVEVDPSVVALCAPLLF